MTILNFIILSKLIWFLIKKINFVSLDLTLKRALPFYFLQPNLGATYFTVPIDIQSGLTHLQDYGEDMWWLPIWWFNGRKLQTFRNPFCWLRSSCPAHQLTVHLIVGEDMPGTGIKCSQVWCYWLPSAYLVCYWLSAWHQVSSRLPYWWAVQPYQIWLIPPGKMYHSSDMMRF